MTKRRKVEHHNQNRVPLSQMEIQVKALNFYNLKTIDEIESGSDGISEIKKN